MAFLEKNLVYAATIEDLYHVPENGKAELVNGRIAVIAPTGEEPGSANFNAAVSLRNYARQTGLGRTFTDNIGFVVNLPHRKSFSPAASFFVGPLSGLRFLHGAPLLAVAVWSANDLVPAAERDMAAERANYFATATAVGWDVDLTLEETV